MVSAIILAGGLGTRLKSSVPHLPKALAPIEETPFLDLLLDHLQKFPFIEQTVLALGYKAEAIQEYLKTRAEKITVSIEKAPMGTGGALILAKEKALSDTLLVLNGDTFCDLDLKALLEFHQENKADFTMASRYLEEASRYGSLTLGKHRKILGFEEKKQEAQEGWINAGIYLFNKTLLDPFPLKPVSLEKEVFPSLLKKRLFAYPFSGTFIDIGTRDSYTEAQTLLQPWTVS